MPVSSGVCPHAGETVGLQFHRDRDAIAGCGVLLLQRTHLALNAKDILHVMTDFMGDDVRLRELSRSTIAAQLIPEAQIEIDLLILRTVEGGRSPTALFRIPSGCSRGTGPGELEGIECSVPPGSSSRCPACLPAQTRPTAPTGFPAETQLTAEHLAGFGFLRCWRNRRRCSCGQ